MLVFAVLAVTGLWSSLRTYRQWKRFRDRRLLALLVANVAVVILSVLVMIDLSNEP